MKCVYIVLVVHTKLKRERDISDEDVNDQERDREQVSQGLHRYDYIIES